MELKCDEIRVLSYYERYYGTKCTISNVSADSSSAFLIRTSNSFEYSKTIQEVEFAAGSSKLYDVPREVFSTFQFLKRLTANNAGIEEISKYNFAYASTLTELRLRSNAIKKLPNSVFANVPQLVTLDFCSNAIAEIEPNALAGLENLQFLTLSDNQLVKLDGSLFRDLKNLTSIRLDSNRLQTIEENLFASTVSLAEIRIDSNEIAIIGNDEVFARLKKLKLLNLGNNRLQHISIADTSVERLWIAQNQLKALKLNRNLRLLYAPMNEISDIDFNGNTELLEIKLRQNRISDIGNFSACTKVEILDLSFNPINSLSIASFARMSDLVKLNLEFTNVSSESLTFGTFAHNPNISQLDLSYNQLGRIDFNIFTALAQLTVLSIDGNNLTQIPFELMKHFFPKLTMISISDNDWNCTYLATMIKQLKLNNVIIRVIARTRVLNEMNVDGIRCVESNHRQHIEWSSAIEHTDDNDAQFSPRSTQQQSSSGAAVSSLDAVWSKISSLEGKISSVEQSLQNYKQQQRQYEALKLHGNEQLHVDSGDMIVKSEVGFIKVILCFMCVMMAAFMLLAVFKFIKTYMGEQRFSFPSESIRRSTATIQTTMEHVM